MILICVKTSLIGYQQNFIPFQPVPFDFIENRMAEFLFFAIFFVHSKG
jgi:hypothetical protein